MKLRGKGLFIWQLWKCEGGDPEVIAAKAKAAGLSHVLIKIADGDRWTYNLDPKTKVDLIPPVRQALKEEGIEVWGWQYVRGRNPIGEARLAIQRTKALGMDGFVIDAEAEYQSTSKRTAATRYMKELRAALPDLPIALSTYRFPKLHRTLPYSEFLSACDYVMPQVYYEQRHNPETQLEICVEQYMALNPARPIIPTAPIYGRGNWRPSADETSRFFAKAKEMGLSAANAWSWDVGSRPAYNDLWSAVADFDWPSDPPAAPVADMPERLVGRLNQHDRKLVAGLYAENAAHVTGERTIFSREAIANWYGRLFREILPEASFEITGKAGSGSTRHYTWTAQSSRGQVIDGNDTLGLREGKIQYHFSYFTVR
ncbi:MAG: hypothetical protein E2O74_06005 [Chloroflexi bacterium]|nr:MAG: hypothetical protein E2O74_06005 [Chloroflexota bacterium]